jgi:hypothetical protein
MANKNVKFTLSAVDKTKAAFDKVTKGLKGVGSVAGKASMGIAKVGLAATASATALAALVKVNVDFMDKLGKTASKLGIEVEFLQAMRFAAEQTGVKVEALDMGLQRFIRRAAEAAQGTGESKRAFEQLGIQLTDNNGNLRDVREILFDVADGLENTTSSAEQVRLAFKFFDSEGVSLVNTLKEGSKGLREFEQEAENLGIIISRQSIAKAEMFANSINILKKQITAISANVTAAFIPALDDISERLKIILADMKGGDTTFENFGKDLAVGILTFMRTAFIGFVEFMNGIKKQIADFSQTKIGKMIFPEMADEQAKLRKDFKETGKELDALNALLDRPDLWDRYKGGVFELGATIANTKNELELIRSQIEGIDPEDSNFIKAFDAMIAKVKDFNLKIDDPKKDDPLGTKKMSEGVSKFKDSLGATDLAIENLTINTMKKFEDTLIEGLKNGKLAFEDFANYAIEQMLRIALQEAIIAPMTGGVESFFKGIFGKKALGGAVNAGKPYMVGESGRELFIPNQGGQIVSNQDLKGINSTQTAPVINLNISANDSTGFDELLVKRKNLLVGIISQAMNQKGNTGLV